MDGRDERLPACVAVRDVLDAGVARLAAAEFGAFLLRLRMPLFDVAAGAKSATIAADDELALKRYQEFTDRYAELTAMLHNSPPPGPRQVLDAALAKHGVVPVEIQRTTGGDDKNAVRTTHLFSWRLSRDSSESINWM